MNSIAQLAAPRVRAPNAFSHFYRLWHSVPETPSYGTEGTLGAQNSLLWYATHFQKLAVLKTGFYGTEEIFGAQKQPSGVRDAFSEAFGAKNRPLGYGRDIRYRKRPPTVRNEATGYDYCVAGSGWKMQPLPTTRRTPTP